MRYFLYGFVCFVVLGISTFSLDFVSEQKKYEKVRIAYAEKEHMLEEELVAHNLSLQNVHILLVAYKHEGELCVYVKGKGEKNYQHFKTYRICRKSGKLGPKNQEGDFQVPEGFYHINHYNPMSNYFLSLGVSYPNQQDRRRSKARDLGGAIYLHGACVTIGCIPITDDSIKEVYVLAVQARQNGQHRIPIYIFPFQFNEANKTKFYTENPTLVSFWKSLESGYTMFEQYHRALKVGMNEEGAYRLSME